MEKNKKQFTTAKQIVADPSSYELEVGQINDNFFKDVTEKEEQTELLQVLCDHPKILQNLLLKDNYERIFYWYFHNPRLYNIIFEKCIANISPEKFVHLFRVNEAFLRNSQLANYMEFDLPTPWSDHVKVWEMLTSSHKQLIGRINETLTELQQKEFSLGESISMFALVLKNAFFYDQKIELLASIYNEFLNRIIKIYNSSEICDLTFYQEIDTSKHKLYESVFNGIFLAIQEFISFKSNLLEYYCFDQTATIRNIGYCINIEQKPEDFYKYQLDGIRYEYTNKCYREAAKNEIGVTESGWLMKNVDVKRKARENMFLDLGIITNSDKNILHVFNAIEDSFVFTAGNNETNQKLNNNGGNALCCFKNVDLDIYMKNNYPEIEKKNFNFYATNSVFGKDGNQIKECLKSYNVLETPFLQIGKYCFCPSVFLMNPDFFYYTAQKILRQNKNEKTAENCEIILSNEFNNAGFSARPLKQKEGASFGGDVDIVVNDYNSNNLLLIQVKNPYFRLSNRDRYNEKINRSEKAIQQLKKSVKIEALIDEYSKTPNVYRWYVSSSFEDVLTEKLGVLKVDYLSLLRILRSKSFLSISDLLNYIKSDKELIDFINDLKYTNLSAEAKTMSEGIRGEYIPNIINEDVADYFKNVTPFPFVLSDPIDYVFPIPENEGYDSKAITDMFVEFLNYGNEIISLGKHDLLKQAILPFFESYVKKYPNDYYGWKVLAEFYQDIWEYSKAINSYNIVLNLLPDDPSTLKELANCYANMGNQQEAMRIVYDCMIRYWYIEFDF